MNSRSGLHIISHAETKPFLRQIHEYIVFLTNLVQFWHNETHNKNIIHFLLHSFSEHRDPLLKIHLHFTGMPPCVISYLIYGSRTAIDKSSCRFRTLFIWRRLMGSYWFCNILKCRRWGWKVVLFIISVNCFKSHISIAVTDIFIAPKLPIKQSKADNIRLRNCSLCILSMSRSVSMAILKINFVNLSP